jgi:putative phage-type endonuclease
LEEQTRGQAQSKLWFKERKFRITASHFGEICKATDRRNLTSLCQNIFEPVQLSSPAILHGKTYEAVALKKFEEMLGTKLLPSGLIVDWQRPFLGASPDGMLAQCNAIVEVKCPYTAKDSTISSTTVSFLENVSGKLQLKRNHSYYFQIQGQLSLAKKSKCYFVVYTHKDLFIEIIPHDDAFCKAMLLSLEAFYTKNYRPYVASRF